MIALMPNLPDTVVGIVASGHVDATDYETVLVPAVEAALKRHDAVRLLYVLGDDFAGFSAGAMWDDMKLGLAHYRAWEKVAVVTDVGWVANAMRMFTFAIPCPMKVFSLKDREQAEAWIAA